MVIVPIQDVYFDDEAALAMGAAFDQACDSIWHLARARKVRELIAKRIVEAVTEGSAIQYDSVHEHYWVSASTT